MAKKGEDQPDPKELEKRIKDAKAVLKEIQRANKELAGVVAQAKQLEEMNG